MFDVGGEYANRIGRYKVLELRDSKMTVEYEDGSTAELSINIQTRIWENILTDQESPIRRTKRKPRRKKRSKKNRFYIKPILVLAAEEVITPGRQGKVESTEKAKRQIKPGDRLIYYAADRRVFFAAVTITGAASKVKSTTKTKSEASYRFPVDVDAFTQNLSKAVQLSSVELESQSNIQETLANGGEYVEISENDFELLAELLTELGEHDEDLDDTSGVEEEYDD